MPTIIHYPPSTFKKIIPKGNGILTEEVDFDSEDELLQAIEKARLIYFTIALIPILRTHPTFMEALKAGVEYG